MNKLTIEEYNLSQIEKFVACESIEISLVPSKDTEGIDVGFEKYLLNKNKESLYAYISAGLSKIESSCKFTVNIVNADHKEPFFGMRVFPSITELKRICHALSDPNETPSLSKIYNQWSRIREWEIEIDDQVFDRMSINLNPQELTALLLHEIGHVKNSGDVVERFYRTYLECALRASNEEKALRRALFSVYSIALAVACTQKTYLRRNDGVKVEVKADRYPLAKGYGEHLISALEKIMKAYGSVLTGNNNNTQHFDDELKSNITWCNINVLSFLVRKNEIAKQMHLFSARRTKGYFRNLVETLIKDVGYTMKEKYGRDKWAVTESWATQLEMETDEFAMRYEWTECFESMLRVDSIIQSTKHSVDSAMEGLLSRDCKKMLPSQYDIDCITVEVDRIENQQDRIYVLNLIYANQQKLDKCEEMMDKNPKMKSYASQIEELRRQLNALRERVLAMHNFSKDYKFFVKYPKGYEG